ncbi:TetR family transcriptional regulator [Actinacidiphila acidipaludis]|uniref:TetR/AcrR family transcriptional regulator n=1 Tax=Actinacidiphila acidipaludis TaxID=2873382 RepID=A0ABS7QE42_9ACTN|nr:TetR family transcriptional regulator [Streptomyces acidipaludis]MBY8881437.1 TetR/AcrR family transcriptional regulator [Streptomyces acidipaludis]
MTPAPKPPMRATLVAAALQLFTERGFEQTTVDDIVALAGVGRRSFFRYFPSKESVVFPDHEGCLRQMTEFLADPEGDAADPVDRVNDAARLVLRMYTNDPEFSVRRYELTRQVPALRSHELSVVRRYENTLANYLRARFAARPDGRLRADVIAAAVVAAHNHALRTWLRSGASIDPDAEVDHALAYVTATWPDRQDREPEKDTSPADDVVVMVARRGTPMWRVVQGVQGVLD